MKESRIYWPGITVNLVDERAASGNPGIWDASGLILKLSIGVQRHLKFSGIKKMMSPGREMNLFWSGRWPNPALRPRTLLMPSETVGCVGYQI